LASLLLRRRLRALVVARNKFKLRNRAKASITEKEVILAALKNPEKAKQDEKPAEARKKSKGNHGDLLFHASLDLIISLSADNLLV